VQDAGGSRLAAVMTPDQDKPCAMVDACGKLRTLAGQVAQLEARASTDSLTGAWNRAHFDLIVEREIDRSLRYKQPISLVLLDVDHFKRVNDEHGHQTGDQILREVATVCGAVTRSSDPLFRWGGEEFAVLALSAGYRGARRLAESLRGQIAAHAFPAVGSLTVSLGVAEHSARESAESWFARADAMLYAAKREGRNRVRVDPTGSSDSWNAEGGLPALHLVWREAYESGEPTIDAQHRELFEVANALIDVLVTGGTEDHVLAAYDRLLDHVVRHFADEEAILERHGYANLESHRRAHSGLAGRAIQLRTAVSEGRAGLGGVVEFLAGDVVGRHLFKSDRDFFPLFGGDPGSPASVLPAPDPTLR
jgi:diguanylate cyclase (GGDEF)-like protein/hemerythrin-like metal-binding protein